MNATLCNALDKIKFKKFKTIKFKGHLYPGSFHFNMEDKAQTHEKKKKRKNLKISTSNISGESSGYRTNLLRGQSLGLSRIQLGFRKEEF